MSKAPDLITAYARNLNTRDRYVSQGQRIPVQLQERIDYVEQIAKVQLTPDQLFSAGEHVSRIRLEDNEMYLQSQQTIKEAWDTAKSDRAFENASSGLSPSGLKLTPDQMAQAHNQNGAYRVENSKMNLEALDKHTRKKFGCSLKVFEDRQEELNNESDPKKAHGLRKKFGISEAEQEAYANDGLNYHFQKRMQENDNEPDSYTEQMDESAQRKNDIMINASFEHGEKVVDDDIMPEYLENDDRQGDIARAFEKSQNDDIFSQVNQTLGLGE